MAGKNYQIKKRIPVDRPGIYVLSLTFVKIDSWDSEWGYVKVDGVTCWSRRFAGSTGSQECGRGGNSFKEEGTYVTCTISTTADYIDVVVDAAISSGANDESFAIDNVGFWRKKELVVVARDDFDDGGQYGWNCRGITTCGNYGKICGGYGLTGKGHVMTKAYPILQMGTYYVSLDFIKVDSWDGERAYVLINGEQCWSRILYWRNGINECGAPGRSTWKEEKIRVSCTVQCNTAECTAIHIQVGGSLNSGTTDESFGIDNVVIAMTSDAANSRSAVPTSYQGLVPSHELSSLVTGVRGFENTAFGALYTCYFRAENSMNITFNVTSSHGSWLFVDKELVISNPAERVSPVTRTAGGELRDKRASDRRSLKDNAKLTPTVLYSSRRHDPPHARGQEPTMPPSACTKLSSTRTRAVPQRSWTS